MKRFFVAAALLAGAVMALPGVASAATGTEHFKIVITNGQPGYVQAGGMFTAAGIDYSKNNVDEFVFSNGTFLARHPAKDSTTTYTLNPKTCVFKATLSGSYTLAKGFGAYQGISGSGTYSGTETSVLPRKANGTCNEQGQPTSSLLTVKASGSVSFK